MKRVAICAVSQHKCESDIWHTRFQGMLLDLLEDIRKQTGFDFDEKKGVRNVVTCSDDVFDARTISDNGMTDVVGSHYRGEEKVAQDGLNALMYAAAMILSGHDDVVYVAGHSKESQGECREMATNLAYDPFYCRPMGLDYLNAAGLQAMAYMRKSGLTQEQMAEIVVRCRKKAARNPNANATEKLEAGKVMASPMVCKPLRSLHIYPVSDGAVAFLLASEERAKEFTDKPVWITGFGSCMDSYFMGDRDLTSNFALKKAARRAYDRAGIKDPQKGTAMVELMDCYAYQQPMWLEGLGFCDDGEGPAFIDKGGADRFNVNLSGGMLAGNPLIIGGLYRAAEAVVQLKGEAGKRQVRKTGQAVVQSTTGGAGQFHSVMVLES
jgi:acetyl-CoA C-acetyltransferase